MSERLAQLQERKEQIPQDIATARGKIMAVIGRLADTYEKAEKVYPMALAAQKSKGRLQRQRLANINDPRAQYFALCDDIMGICDELWEERRAYKELEREWASVHRSIEWFERFPQWIKSLREGAQA